MEDLVSYIIATLLTALAAGIASYFGAYMKVAAEIRASTAGLRQTIENLRETTQAVEGEKARIMIDSTMGAELRKAVYALATAVHALMHAMCWLSWDTQARHIVRSDLSRAYDAEAHQLIPEIFGQMAVIQLLDRQLHARASPFVESWFSSMSTVAMPLCWRNKTLINPSGGSPSSSNYPQHWLESRIISLMLEWHRPAPILPNARHKPYSGWPAHARTLPRQEVNSGDAPSVRTSVSQNLGSIASTQAR